MGPLDLFIGWQPLLIAMLAYMLTQLVKAIIDSTMGKEKRKANLVLTRVVLPALAPIFGALAALAPAHPQSMMDYVVENNISVVWAQLMFCTWGAACGQFADYFYSKAKALATHAA